MFSKIALAATLTISAQSALSIGIDDDHGAGVPETLYLSWCVKNNVVQSDTRGQEVIQFNCAEQDLRCVQEERLQAGARISFAICKP